MLVSFFLYLLEVNGQLFLSISVFLSVDIALDMIKEFLRLSI